MPTAGQYFAEFEFWSASTQLYWLPLRLVAPTPADADAFVASVRRGLAGRYTIIRETPATRIVRGLGSASVREFHGKKLVGIPNTVDLELWTMASIRTSVRIRFAEIPEPVENLVIELSGLGLKPGFVVELADTGAAPPAHLLLFNVVIAGE